MTEANSPASPPSAPPGTPSGSAPGTPRSEPPPSTETLRERGAIRHDSVRAAHWMLDGTAKVTGAVEVGVLDVRGALVVGANLVAGRVRSRATLEVGGPVEVRGTFASHGSLRAGATVHAVDLEVSGVARIQGLLRVDRTCTSKGNLHAPDLSVGVLQLEGSVHVPGQIQALSVEGRLHEASELGAVTARTVRLRGPVPNVVDKVFFHDPTVVVQRIDAESVELTGVEARFVHAQKIVLGRACHIAAVEGTVASCHPSSTVGPESRTPAPFGLRR